MHATRDRFESSVLRAEVRHAARRAMSDHKTDGPLTYGRVRRVERERVTVEVLGVLPASKFLEFGLAQVDGPRLCVPSLAT